MKKFFRKLRAAKYAMRAWDLWDAGVRDKLETLAETDAQVREFRDNIDNGWRIISRGKA